MTKKNLKIKKYFYWSHFFNFVWSQRDLVQSFLWWSQYYRGRVLYRVLFRKPVACAKDLDKINEVKQMKFIAFDLEGALIEDKSENTQVYGGISVIATADANGQARVWYSQTSQGKPLPYLTAEDAQLFLVFLSSKMNAGYHIVSWNGAGYDFRVLAQVSHKYELCQQLALDHFDPMLQFLCLYQFPVGLDATARAMKTGAKTEGIYGADAPTLWQQHQYEKVITYVKNDALITLQTVEAIVKRKHIKWFKKKGGVSFRRMPQLLTVRESLQLPYEEPLFWAHPLTPQKLTGWLTNINLLKE